MKLSSTLQLAALILGLAIIAAPVLAGPKQDWRDCKRGVIQACTRIIEGRRESRHNLSIAYCNRGIAYYDKGQYEHALADYDQAIKLNRKLAPAYGGRGLAYIRKGQYDRAIGDFDQAIRLDPKYVGAYCSRGIAYQKIGRLDRAITDYDQAIKLKPNYAVA